MTIRKFKLFADHDKEEKWLNEMAAQGLYLVHYKFGRYYFEQGEPNEYTYRIEMLSEYPDQEKSKEYIEFLEENGVELITTYFMWAYFRKKTEDGPFEIYSDHTSKIRHYKKIASVYGILSLINLIIAIANAVQGTLVAYISVFNIFAVLLLTPSFVSYLMKINKLKKESVIYNK